MNTFDRIYELRAIFQAHRYPVSAVDLEAQMECSWPTVKRAMRKMRDELGAPVRYDRKYKGYILDRAGEEQHELPGLWFSVSELHALLTLHELLNRMQPGLLRQEFSPFRQRIESILEGRKMSTGEVFRRFRFFSVGARTCLPDKFHLAASATLQRRKLDLRYQNRAADSSSSRVVSPQRLIYYRENWYLDTWCHQAGAFRTFALDRVSEIVLLDETALEIADEELDDHYAGAFGIFSGPATRKAVLRFTPQRARWIAAEQWHPDQQGTWLSDGSYQLCLPYGDSRELVLDILRYGPDVEVVAPDELRCEVRKRLKAALKQYEE
ncbi:MAG: WYL domain-containing protein [Desulfobulbaceae bacterium]|jgi:predicted DNA-binding transcriptional regulator YafY|nr:WYL domain-containing protein [Desulfobulbaceae bacterium]